MSLWPLLANLAIIPMIGGFVYFIGNLLTPAPPNPKVPENVHESVANENAAAPLSESAPESSLSVIDQRSA